MKNMIEITGVDLQAFAKKAYALSIPQGLGMLHTRDGELSNEIAEQLVNSGYNDLGFPSSRPDKIALNMDYVHGRACKMTVFREEDKLFINSSWYDHTDLQLSELLKEFNIKTEATSQHGVACNCDTCIIKRGRC